MTPLKIKDYNILNTEVGLTCPHSSHT